MPKGKRGYRLADGTKVTGVTTVLNRFKETSGLLYWAFEQGKAAERGEIEKLYDKRDSAAVTGKLVHSLVEDHLKGKEIGKIEDNLVKKGYENYLNWQSNNKIVIDKQEISLVSERWGFGGTVDGAGHDSKSRRIIVDWKTSDSVYHDYLLQLAAYGYLWNENYPDDLITGGYHLCRFSKTYGDFVHHYFEELNDAWEQFKLLLAAFKLDKRVKERI